MKKPRTEIREHVTGSIRIRTRMAVVIAMIMLSGSVIMQAAHEKMKLIPAQSSSFEMGSTRGNSDEQPVHSVRFTYSYWMDTTEVTQADYSTVMNAAYSNYAAPSWGNPHGVGARYPVYAVEWSDAVLYCNALSKRDGLDTVYSYQSISGHPGNGSEVKGIGMDMQASGYRLPTEAEWEYACRAGTTGDFYWGKDCDPYPASSSDSTEIGRYAVWSGNSWNLSADISGFGTHPVAELEPNAYGLYDMSGNVYEWINDWYADYTSDEQVDPTGASEESYHFVRGGSWGNSAWYLRSSNRSFTSPDYYIYFCGFRTVARNTTTATLEGQVPTMMTHYLSQNYPNPFNQTTIIQFTLPGETHVSLTIYNILGSSVQNLIDRRLMAAGTHSISYQAKDLESGVYFYRLDTDAFSQVRKMIVMK
ncbi:MAG: SUMF1/EgtB/PvdO family nonheme iron enzyme [Candidatus Delongbacteria bacterium]|nr:SUMF1/EgtB/PvdO family nonheme iron enzyme [Candidatus Delongbacteria bacterium]